jgi:Protein of unknown function (DUF3617)
MQISLWAIVTSLGIFFLATVPSLGAAQMLPGLWEINGKVQNNDKSSAGKRDPSQNNIQIPAELMDQIKDQLAETSPELSKKMEPVSQFIKNMTFNSDGSVTMKLCFTKDMIVSRKFLDQPGKCTQTRDPVVGNSQKFSFSCTDPATNGEGTIIFQNTKAYTSNAKISTVLSGKTETALIDNKGKFLSADCGDVKPLVMPAS